MKLPNSNDKPPVWRSLPWLLFAGAVLLTCGLCLLSGLQLRAEAGLLAVILALISAGMVVNQRQCRRWTATLMEHQKAVAAAEERFQLVTQANNDGVWDWDWVKNRSYHSPRCLEIMGAKKEDLETDSYAWLSWVHPEDRARIERIVQAYLEGKTAVMSYECRMIRPDGRQIWVFGRGIARRGSDGVIRRFAGSLTDITYRKQVEERLKASHDLMEAILEGTQDCVFAKDLNHRYVMVNRAGMNWFRSVCPDVVGRHLYELYSEQSARELMTEDVDIVAKAEWVTRQKTLYLADGSRQVVVTTKGPHRDATGSIIGVLGIARDITELKRTEHELRESLSEKEVLLKEIHHRVKNNLQVISGLLYLQAEHVHDQEIRHALFDSRQRVHAIALVHERLYKSDDLARIDFNAYYRSWKSAFIDCFSVDPGKIHIEDDVQPVLLSVDEAIPCALIMQELISNSVKHAFPEGSGHIQVVFGIQNGRYRLCIADDGVGLRNDFEQSNSLGLRLVSVLSKQLRATTELSTGHGTQYSIEFQARPLERKTKRCHQMAES